VFDSEKYRCLGYTILSKFEKSLRDMVNKKIDLLYSNYKEGIPIGILEKVNKRLKNELPSTLDIFLNSIDFPDLSEIIVFKGLYKYYFAEYKLPQQDFLNHMLDLYKLRCKIAHVRGIFTSLEIDELLEKARDIANALEENGSEILSFLEKIENDPEKFIQSIPSEFYVEVKQSIPLKIPNNLPVPDYEHDGGFIGRENDIKKIAELLQGDLHRVITITGAGGVGKTATALKVIQKVIESNPTCFDGIVFLSAKENKLSLVGIEDFEPTLKNYDELLDTILKVLMGYDSEVLSIESKENEINALFDLYKRVLIVIDNLETVTDDRIKDFILDSHKNLKILITSRKGLGQVERIYELNQLNPHEAILLFRQIAKEKKLITLSRLDNEIILKYVNKVACFPLAIKWLIGNVALGKDINAIIDSILGENSDIAKFCFEHIYSNLSENSKKLLCSFSLSEAPMQAGVIKYISDLNQYDFEDSISELILVSLVMQEQNKNNTDKIGTKYDILSLTRGYIRNQLDKNYLLKKDLENRLKTAQSKIEESEKVKSSYSHSLSNLGACTDEEKVAVVLVHAAYQKFQSGLYEDAVEDYKRAREIAPNFYSIYRNWAVMEYEQGHVIESDGLMKKATEINPTDFQLWLIWGSMKRKEDKIKDAIKYYHKAFEIKPNDPIILNSLGQAKSRNGDHEEAKDLFFKALEIGKTIPGHNIKNEIINRCSIADNFRRWGEELSRQKKIKEAKHKLNEALDQISTAEELDPHDTKTKDLFRQIVLNLAHFYKNSCELDRAIKLFHEVIIDNPIRFKEIKDTIKASKELLKIYLDKQEFNKAKNLISKNLLKLAQRNEPLMYKQITSLLSLCDQTDSNQGRIISVNESKGFTIIESLSSPGDTYLGHINDFVNVELEIGNNLIGKNVLFKTYLSNDEKKKAKMIIIQKNSDEKQY
jgi:LuxR family transcriptional regulator, glucitol operon activator